MTMDINSMLYRLCSVDGVSGDERGASEIALSMLESYTDAAVLTISATLSDI